MIVYVESNFILEAAYLQEQHASCVELLALGHAAKIELKLPAYSVIEARLSLQQRTHRRRTFHDELRRQVRELERSKPYQKLSPSIGPLSTALIESGEAEKTGLDAFLLSFLANGELLPIQGTTIQRGTQCEIEFGLSPQDAVILACILEDLPNRGAGPKLFLNRNSKDFANPDIYDELDKLDCKIIPSFTDGLMLVRGRIQTSDQADASPKS